MPLRRHWARDWRGHPWRWVRGNRLRPAAYAIAMNALYVGRRASGSLPPVAPVRARYGVDSKSVATGVIPRHGHRPRPAQQVAAAASGPLVVLGDRLVLFRALAANGPLSSTDLAGQLALHERYVREWLHNRVAAQYVQYAAASARYFMTPEQAACLADADSPAYLPGGYYAVTALYPDEPKAEEAFRTGQGIGWGDHSNCLFCGAEKFFGPGYKANLMDHWLPALDGVVAKLTAGASVADVGCGHALSTRLMARPGRRSGGAVLTRCNSRGTWLA